jgi:hypothetical protein
MLVRGVSRVKGVQSERFARGASMQAGSLSLKLRTVCTAPEADFGRDGAL